MTYVGVFLIVAFADMMWTKYILHAAARRAEHAGAYSAGIVLMGGLSVLAYQQSAWNLIPAALGAYVGTWWTVRRG